VKPANNAIMDSAPESKRISPQGLAERHHDADDDNSIDFDSDSDSEYVSFDDIEDQASDKETRERERQLVLEAAGLVVNQDAKPPPKPKHRPAPCVPQPVLSRQKTLPRVPDSKAEPDPDIEKVDYEASLDDAFARYESFRNTQSNLNRLSVISTESGTSPVSPTPTISSMAMSLTHSGGGESSSRYSHFLQFLKSGNKTPEGERRSVATLNISAPIMNLNGSSPSTPQDVPPRLNTPSFGTVRPLLGPDYNFHYKFLFLASLGPVLWTKQLWKAFLPEKGSVKR
jgi:actin cytoskeleton-regulatory complex protein PAN1